MNNTNTSTATWLPQGPYRQVVTALWLLGLSKNKQKTLSQSLSTCYIFIDLVNIIPHKVTVLNCLCFLSWGCRAPLLRGPGILSCKPKQSEGLLTLFYTSTRFLVGGVFLAFFFLFILWALGEGNGLHYVWTIHSAEAWVAADSWE